MLCVFVGPAGVGWLVPQLGQGASLSLKDTSQGYQQEHVWWWIWCTCKALVVVIADRSSQSKCGMDLWRTVMGHTVDFFLTPPHCLCSCTSLQDLNPTKAQLHMNRLLRNSLMAPFVRKLVWESAVSAFDHITSTNTSLSGKTYQIFPDPLHTTSWKTMNHAAHFRVRTGLF